MSELLFHDAPEGVAVPADNIRIRTEIDGSIVFGRTLLPALDDPDKRTPVVLFMHGFPGTEKNTDIAQLLRMTGVACAGFFFRGVWGSKGYYSFSHLIEDAAAIVGYLRKNAEKLRIDPDRVYLFGHSMGGFTAVNAIADGLKVKGAFLLAPCDLGERYLYEPEQYASLLKTQQGGYFNLQYEDALKDDIVANAEKWYFPNAAKRMSLETRYFFIGGKRDTTTPPEKNILPILEALRARGAQAELLMLNDEHGFAGSRFAVAEFVAKNLWNIENG